MINRTHHNVSTSFFEDCGSPINIGHLELHCPEDTQYILRMIIRCDGGNYIIPQELDWVMPIISLSIKHQKQIGVDHPFCYVTVRHGLVSSTTDDEWHVDGFSTRIAHTPEQNYIWSNVSPTEYAENLKVTFPNDFDPLKHNVNTFLEKHITKINQCDENAVYCCDPYILHRRPTVDTNIRRTFVRVSHVPIEIDDIKNTQNDHLPRLNTKDGVSFRNTLINYGE